VPTYSMLQRRGVHSRSSNGEGFGLVLPAT
jgi:hypothetical protein